MSIVFCKYSNDRAKAFQIKTIIEETNGQKKVIKSAVWPEGKKHIESIIMNQKRLKELFEGSIFKVNQCNEAEDNLLFEYIEGKTLEEILDDMYMRQDYMGVIEKLKEYVNLINSIAKEEFICGGKDFERVFGVYKSNKRQKGCAISNIDIIPANIIVNDYWNVIDYEWTFDFVVPVDFIIYRGLYYYIHGTTKRDQLFKYNIFELFGISASDREKYEIMEANFQKYVMGNNVGVNQYKNIILKPSTNAVKAIEQENENINYFKIYIDYGEGCSEQNSVYYKYDLRESNNIKMYYPVNGKKVKKLRLVPGNGWIICTINKLCWRELHYEDIEYCTNGIIYGNMLAFDNENPHIEFSVSCGETVNLLIDMNIYNVNEFVVNEFFCHDRERNKYIERCNMLENEYSRLSKLNGEYIKLKADFEHINNEYARLQAENGKISNECARLNIENNRINSEYAKLNTECIRVNNEYAKLSEECKRVNNEYARLNSTANEMSGYINSLHSKKIWRVLRALKKFAKSIKQNGIIKTIKKSIKKIKQKLEIRKSNKENIVVIQSIGNNIRTNHNYVKEKREKIILVVHEAQTAGATLLAMSILKTIKKITNYEPIVLLVSGGPLEETFREEARVYSLNNQGFSCLGDERNLNNILDEIEKEGIKYALCNSVVTGLTVKALKEHGIRTITMVHELSTSIHVYDYETAAAMVSKYSDYIVFPAEFVKKSFCNDFKPNEEKCRIISQGIYSNIGDRKIEDKTKYKDELCKMLNIPRKSKIVMGCGYGNFRKGLDLFGQIALKVLPSNEKYHFIWLGSWDKEFYNWINSDLKSQGIDNRFHWMGFMNNPSIVFSGSDAYLLTSREDPFPSVALEAMAQFSVVLAFENTGGIPEILTSERGIVVPYCDCDKMAKELLNILDSRNSKQLNNIIKNAKATVDAMTPERYVESLLNTLTGNSYIKKSIEQNYKVSVVIPNYNYERYIPERLNSILNQTYKPHEIIFLDDCSKDNSIEVAESILKDSGINYRIIANETNNGCFKQWLKGIESAQGDIIWIAEADDYCEAEFLERLMGFFDDDQVNLAYAQSEVIYENGEHSGFIYTEYTKELDEKKWHYDYVNSGESEIIDGLGIMNTIPNASGVLLRRSALAGLENELKSYTISGDWFTYVYTLRIGKIAFCSEVLNYHRRHKNSIIHKREQDIQMFVELMNIKLFIAKNFLIPESIKKRFLNHIKSEYNRLSGSGKAFEDQAALIEKQKELESVIEDQIRKYSFLKNDVKKNIMFVAPDFEMGGGQTLIVRLANYFSRFHNVYVYNARPWQEEARIKNMFSERVIILDSNGTPEQLKKYVKDLKIDVINDHIWWSDKIAYKAAKDENVNIVLSMHGCYEGLLDNPDWDGEFEKMAPMILKRANHIIYATDKNKRIFETVQVEDKAEKIYYGYEIESIPKKNREDIGASEDSFIFGLVARGIKEKGFEEAILAFEKLMTVSKRDMHLVLIGNGTFIDKLKKRYSDKKNIHFVDNLTKPSEWIGWVKTFDVGLLPSYFISESLPNTIIEYLAYDLPVISTNIGDIPYMIKNDKYEAGIVLELKNMQVDVDKLMEAMAIMINDTDLYKSYKKGAVEMFKQFDMKNFAEKYYKLYSMT